MGCYAQTLHTFTRAFWHSREERDIAGDLSTARERGRRKRQKDEGGGKNEGVRELNYLAGVKIMLLGHLVKKMLLPNVE